MKKKITVVGGGTGSYTALKGLKGYDIDLAAIVSMFDSGGSTGVLRDELGVLPPGDLRKCLIALADEEGENVLRELFSYRFEGGVGDHSLGNLILTAAQKRYGNIAKGIGKLSKILNLKGDVYPVSLDDCTLCAKLKDGEVIEGEANIDVPVGEREPIDYVYLKPGAKVYSDVEKVLADSDLIVIGPGDLYTSVIPNLLVEGVPEAIRKSSAKTVYVCNLMTKQGETDDYKASDFLREVEKYLGGPVDYVICNENGMSAESLAIYEDQNQFPVEVDLKDERLIKANILYQKNGGKDLIRHHREMLAKELMKIVDNI